MLAGRLEPVRRMPDCIRGGFLTKPSGVTSVEARPPAFSLESKINHDGPFYKTGLVDLCITAGTLGCACSQGDADAWQRPSLLGLHR